MEVHDLQNIGKIAITICVDIEVSVGFITIFLNSVDTFRYTPPGKYGVILTTSKLLLMFISPTKEKLSIAVKGSPQINLMSFAFKHSHRRE